MKKYFISLFMLASITSMAMTNETSKNEKKATVSTISTVESNAALAMKQLQEENLLLRQQIFELSNDNEELKGMISFQTMMHKVFAHLGAQKQRDEHEELKAQISYNAMMANVVRVLQTPNSK